MKESENLKPERILKLLKEAGVANEQMERTKRLRNSVNSLLSNNENAVAEALKEFLKQPKKK